MTVQLDLPDDVTAALEQRGDVSRCVLEAIAVEGYRRRELTRSQVRRMLGFESSLQVDEFMSAAGVPFPYDTEDLDADVESLREAGLLPSR